MSYLPFSPAILVPSHLTISVLGPLQFRLGVEQISRFEFERVRALLVYLAVEAVPHDRAWLAYLLWPSASLKVGLQNLRQTLAALRRAVKEKEQKTPFLVATPTTLRFNPESNYFLDLERFAGLIQETESHKHRRLGICSSCMSRLEEAVGLYRGDFAGGANIDSEPFEEWLREKQEQTHLQTIRALSQLTDYYLRHNQVTQAIQAARRQLALYSLCDDGHHQLILALAADGQRHAALKQCEQYKAVLDEELMLPLPDKTADLYQQLAGQTWQEATTCLSPRHILPKPLTPFAGYEKQLALIRERLTSADGRLLTLTGIVGSGKSRLALEAAWAELPNFEDGVYYLDLEGVAAGEMLGAVARLLLPEISPNCSLENQLTTWLRSKEALLVLDHFDHLIESDAAGLRLLLRDAAKLQILVTSRERLKARGETVVELKGLEYPADGEVAQFVEYEAVRFFRQRVGQAEGGLALELAVNRDALLHICRNTGGNPRALELYAQAAELFPLPQVLRAFYSLAHWGELMSSALPQRQRSFKAMFHSSWHGLTAEEQRALISLAVFEDSFNLTAAQVVDHVEPLVLLSLQAKSWLQPAGMAVEAQLYMNGETGGGLRPARYCLPALFRPYLRQLMAQKPSLRQELQRQHSLYFMNFLSESLAKLPNERDPAATLQAIQQDQGNIEQALAWASAEHSHLIKAQLEQDLSLFHLYASRSQLVEAPLPFMNLESYFQGASWASST